jgi:hypothetical protein
MLFFVGLALGAVACGSRQPGAPSRGAPGAADGVGSVPVKVFVLAPATPGQQPEGAVRTGCDEYLVPELRPVPAGSTAARARAAVSQALAANPDAAELSVAAVEARPDGTLRVALQGRPRFAGVCGVPRLTGQVRLTLEQFGKAEVELNGSGRAWRCLGDESGECR